MQSCGPPGIEFETNGVNEGVSEIKYLLSLKGLILAPSFCHESVNQLIIAAQQSH